MGNAALEVAATLKRRLGVYDGNVINTFEISLPIEVAQAIRNSVCLRPGSNHQRVFLVGLPKHRCSLRRYTSMYS